MHMKKRLSYTLLASASLVALSIGALSVSTMAWFATNRQAGVSFMSLSVDAGYSISGFYFYKGNYNSKNKTFSGYQDIRYTLKESEVSSITDFSSDFISVPGAYTDESGSPIDPRSMPDFFPGLCHTFAIKVTSESSKERNMRLYLTQYSSNPATDRFIEDSSGAKTTNGVQLASAIDIYSKGWVQTSNADDTAKAEAFISTEMSAGPTDMFTFLDYSSFSENYTLYDGTIGAGETKIILFTVEFSNLAETFYKFSSIDNGNYYYKKDATGNSSVYQGLSFSISSLLVGE